jgi:hypothetical protein
MTGRLLGVHIVGYDKRCRAHSLPAADRAGATLQALDLLAVRAYSVVPPGGQERFDSPVSLRRAFLYS